MCFLSHLLKGSLSKVLKSNLSNEGGCKFNKYLPSHVRLAHRKSRPTKSPARQIFLLTKNRFFNFGGTNLPGIFCAPVLREAAWLTADKVGCFVDCLQEIQKSLCSRILVATLQFQLRPAHRVVPLLLLPMILVSFQSMV